MEQVTADYITANSPLTPVVKAAPNGRVNCTDSNGAHGAELSDVGSVSVGRRARRPAAFGGGSPTARTGQAGFRRPRRRE